MRWARVSFAGISVVVVSLFSPDLVTGSQQAHVPLDGTLA
jgi:hypothetical protein